PVARGRTGRRDGRERARGPGRLAVDRPRQTRRVERAASDKSATDHRGAGAGDRDARRGTRDSGAQGRRQGEFLMKITTVNAAAIKEASEKLSNWGKWGKDDLSGTLNYVEPHHIIEAGKLIKKGKSFALGIPLDRTGPQSGLFGGRFNPIHQMLATG